MRPLPLNSKKIYFELEACLRIKAMWHLPRNTGNTPKEPET